MAITSRIPEPQTRRLSSEASSSGMSKEQMHHALHSPPPPCGACPFCEDTCGNPICSHCDEKMNKCGCSSSSIGSKSHCRSSDGAYTMCEIRRHNTEQSCWLVAGDTIYDATSYISQHPGGATSILKKSGGVADCSEDLMFHSKNGRKVWKKYVVGKVKKCPGPDGSLQGDVDKHWWMFWA